MQEKKESTVTPTTPLSNIFRINKETARGLKKLNIETVRDLLFHFPTRYEDISEIKQIAQLQPGETAIIYGQITSSRTRRAVRKKTPLTEATIKDTSGSIKLVWFHQAYIATMLPVGTFVKLKGRVTEQNGTLSFINPEFEKLPSLPIDAGDSLFSRKDSDPFRYSPIYPESKGVTSRWIHHHILTLLPKIKEVTNDPIPEDILKKYNLPTLHTALVWIHTPQKESDARAARKRFAFEEVFFIQLAAQKARQTYEKLNPFVIDTDTSHTDIFPFQLTRAQQRAIADIFSDMKSGKPMMRLLEGDVGSGKTAVAAATAYAVVNTPPKGQNFGTLQVAYMAPTEILAQQQFDAFVELFKHLPISIGLITGSGCKKFPSKVDTAKPTSISRTQLLKWVKNGEIALLVGTHALIQKQVAFKHLAYVIIDEQHRFGTAQRMALARKHDRAPHLLSMTATPIPRTLALTIYGDLDLTLLDEMPEGRKRVITRVVAPQERKEVYALVQEQLKEGRQVYVICPRINEPDPDKQKALNTASVVAETQRLKKDIFPDYHIGMLHGKMTPKEKENVMEQFSRGEIDILVSTSVVEVGVNVPNATVIIIEGAERFGLAQLHQLRGRVARSAHQAYCFCFTETQNKTSIERLQALSTAKNGFELAEYDLHARGAGELAGGKQWGISDLGMEAIKNIKMVEAARKEAAGLLEKNPLLADSILSITRKDISPHLE